MNNLEEILNQFKLIDTKKLIIVLTYTKFTPYLISKYELNVQNDVLNFNINPQWYLENDKSIDITQHIIVFNDLYNMIVFDLKNNKELFRTKYNETIKVTEFIQNHFQI